MFLLPFPSLAFPPFMLDSHGWVHERRTCLCVCLFCIWVRVFASRPFFALKVCGGIERRRKKERKCVCMCLRMCMRMCVNARTGGGTKRVSCHSQLARRSVSPPGARGRTHNTQTALVQLLQRSIVLQIATSVKAHNTQLATLSHRGRGESREYERENSTSQHDC